MSDEIKRCPDCYDELREQLIGDVESGYYSTRYLCPNVGNHGKKVKCANECGEDVPNAQFHYHYTPGLLGSGNWQCFRNNYVRKSPIMKEVREGKEALQRMRDEALKKKD